MFVCAQLRLTLFDPMDCSPPSSFARGIFQSRILEQAISTPEDLLNSGIEPVSLASTSTGKWVLYYCSIL